MGDDLAIGNDILECICNRVLDKFLGKTNWVLDVESGGASCVLLRLSTEILQ